MPGGNGRASKVRVGGNDRRRSSSRSFEATRGRGNGGRRDQVAADVARASLQPPLLLSSHGDGQARYSSNRWLFFAQKSCLRKKVGWPPSPLPPSSAQILFAPSIKDFLTQPQHLPPPIVQPPAHRVRLNAADPAAGFAGRAGAGDHWRHFGPEPLPIGPPPRLEAPNSQHTRSPPAR